MRQLIFIILGVLFGMVMYKGEAASWFRIYEMFTFQSIHMYGFIASALIVGFLGLQLMKRFVKNVHGNPIVTANKNRSVPRYLFGGIIFGLGWALVGACPGPIFVLIGAGVWPMLIVAAFALLGTYLYGIAKDKLPH
ncbi:YeeE/YedE thiosulfate transporter family protein [Sphingobacterium oryzagri]|uniref:YeeE/YedE thiosulfate transporter family protein n=1 Tax=Sphingobacterium oryzagri TaxID=3025669 RepID=A0ABY7WAR0_9SPHI|nr:DUF6691 family protein [Sphingobacterium sp. KACC 22765]WDF66771.1 YeeE/YedE thiosulfate transporter family protein [Sphingobacterium sp. KACC 22765]